MIRKYTAKDKTATMGLLRLNTPAYFDVSEERAFESYLDNEIEEYFVYEENAKLIGAGGINYFVEEKIARISWDMIDPSYQGKGIGRKLTQYRINHLKNAQDVEWIIVRTSQLVYKFYEKMGFHLDKIVKDYWAKNYHLYQMKMSNKLLSI